MSDTKIAARENGPGLQRRRQLLLGGLLAMFVGLAAVLMPQLIIPMKAYDSPVFPFVRTAIEGLTLFTFAGLLIGSFVVGWFFRHPIILGLVTMLPFYLFAVIEILVDPQSHKLWMVEFIIYIALSLIAVLGASLSSWVKQLIQRDNETQSGSE